MQARQELQGEKFQHSVAELTKKLGESEKKVQLSRLESTELQKRVGNIGIAYTPWACVVEHVVNTWCGASQSEGGCGHLVIWQRKGCVWLLHTKHEAKMWTSQHAEVAATASMFRNKEKNRFYSACLYNNIL